MNKNSKQREEWWSDSRRMQFDALVCLVSRSGRAIFFSVCNPEPTRFSTNKGTVEDDTEVGPSVAEAHYERRRTGMPSLHKDPDRASLALTMVDFKAKDMRWLTLQLAGISDEESSLVEFPGILLPSFKPTLEALQKMSGELDLPFEEMLAPERVQNQPSKMEPPAYTRQRGFAYDLSPLTGGEPFTFVPSQSLEYEELEKSTILDQAQLTSALHALNSKLALIQGPPGTGKSFTGVSIIKTLLKNRNAADIGPIICVCYTNHALDQLMESLVRDQVSHVIRIGGRSKSEMLEKLNLRHVAQMIEDTKSERSRKWEYHQYISSSITSIDSLLTQLNKAPSWEDIKEYLEGYYPRHCDELFKLLGEAGFQLFVNKRHDPIRCWLNGSPSDGPAAQRSSWRPTQQPTHEEVERLRSVDELVRSPLASMTNPERRILHNYWIFERTQSLNDRVLNQLEEYTRERAALDECYQELNLRCLRQAHVIGVTTSGLAKNLKILRNGMDPLPLKFKLHPIERKTLMTAGSASESTGM